MMHILTLEAHSRPWREVGREEFRRLYAASVPHAPTSPWSSSSLYGDGPSWNFYMEIPHPTNRWGSDSMRFTWGAPPATPGRVASAIKGLFAGPRSAVAARLSADIMTEPVPAARARQVMAKVGEILNIDVFGGVPAAKNLGTTDKKPNIRYIVSDPARPGEKYCIQADSPIMPGDANSPILDDSLLIHHLSVFSAVAGVRWVLVLFAQDDWVLLEERMNSHHAYVVCDEVSGLMDRLSTLQHAHFTLPRW